MQHYVVISTDNGRFQLKGFGEVFTRENISEISSIISLRKSFLFNGSIYTGPPINDPECRKQNNALSVEDHREIWRSYNACSTIDLYFYN